MTSGGLIKRVPESMNLSRRCRKKLTAVYAERHWKEKIKQGKTCPSGYEGKLILHESSEAMEEDALPARFYVDRIRICV